VKGHQGGQERRGRKEKSSGNRENQKGTLVWGVRGEITLPRADRLTQTSEQGRPRGGTEEGGGHVDGIMVARGAIAQKN